MTFAAPDVRKGLGTRPYRSFVATEVRRRRLLRVQMERIYAAQRAGYKTHGCKDAGPRKGVKRGVKSPGR